MLLIKGAYQSANLVNFHMSSQNSEIWILMGSFLSKKHELWAISWHWRLMQNLRKNWLVVCKIVLSHFHQTTQISENLHFDGLLLLKAYNVWAKKEQRIIYVSWHWRVMWNLKEN